MAEIYKHLYEQTKRMLTMYQDELIPEYRKKIEELEAKVATDNNVGSKWIPVTERLPDLELVDVKKEDMDLFPCLVYKVSQGQRRMKVVTKAWYDGQHFMDSDCIYITKYVTHWMPLPEPPKEGRQ